jgi:hypothetical protein
MFRVKIVLAAFLIRLASKTNPFSIKIQENFLASSETNLAHQKKKRKIISIRTAIARICHLVAIIPWTSWDNSPRETPIRRSLSKS